LHIIFIHWKCIENRTVLIIYRIDQKKERIRTKKQKFDRTKTTICLLIVMFFLISVTVATAANNSEVKKGAHAAKKVKQKLDPTNNSEVKKGAHTAKKVKQQLDPDIAAGKTELTPLQANKYNLGDYAGSSTTIDTPDGASNTVNMGVNAGIQFDDGPYPGNRILEGDHAGTSFNFGNYPGITFNDAPKKGFSAITTNPYGNTALGGKTLYSSAGLGSARAPAQNKGKYVGLKFNDSILA
jgi:hypothetical protein